VERVGVEQRLRDRFDGERLPRARAGDDAEALTGSLRRDGKARGEGRQLGAARLPEQGLEVEPEGELDRLTGRPRRGDDDEATARIPGPDEGLAVRGQIAVTDRAEGEARVGYG